MSSRPSPAADPPSLPPRRRKAALTASTGRHGATRARLIALVGVALIAFAAGAVAGSEHVDRRIAAVDSFGQAWEIGDHAAMHALLDPGVRSEVPLARFAGAYRSAAQTLTLATMRAGAPERIGEDVYALPVTFETRVFGTLRGRIRLHVREVDGESRLGWTEEMVFPGLDPGERLRRETQMPPRGAIVARDGTPLAEGPDRLTDLGRAATDVVGTIGPIPPQASERAAERGLPPDALIGLSGIERAYEGRLAGRPGGRLMAGERIIARRSPEPGRDVRTTIDPQVQAAASEALAGRYGGAVALDPRDGELLAVAGIGASAPQPPGSVFKIITLAAALEHDVVERSASFPVTTDVILEGVRLENANGEACGGTLRNAFAHSCNSVFAPLGVRVGAKRLVAMAERFGFNRPARIPGAQPSSLPPAEEIGDDLAIGSTAIGQGRVLATTLQMASVAATIAARGMRRPPVVVEGERQDAVRAIPAPVASTISDLMVEVVESGTGTAAAIPGVRVAGKTGTAELRSTVRAPGADPLAPDDPSDTDAWFAAFAPERRPRLAVAILLVEQGTGGENAAPAARVLLASGLHADQR